MLVVCDVILSLVEVKYASSICDVILSLVEVWNKTNCGTCICLCFSQWISYYTTGNGGGP